jgi:hypothetical protein
MDLRMQLKEIIIKLMDNKMLSLENLIELMGKIIWLKVKIMNYKEGRTSFKEMKINCMDSKV